MDNSKQTNNNIGSEKATKLLLSVSAFSIVLYYSAFVFLFSIISLLDIYVSAFTKQSFSSALEKNCVFLLFNGLLVIIFAHSGLIRKSSQLDTSNGGIVFDPSPHALQQVVSENNVEEEDEKNGRVQLLTLEEEEDDDDEKNGGVQLLTLEEEEEEKTELDEVNNRIIVFEEYEDSEEFNKKCDDFIRRVKEGIKLGLI